MLRRQQGEADAETTVVYDDVIIHPGRYEVRTGDQMVYLTPTEFHILHFLARRPGWCSHAIRSSMLYAVKTPRSLNVPWTCTWQRYGANSASIAISSKRCAGWAIVSDPHSVTCKSLTASSQNTHGCVGTVTLTNLIP